MTFSQDVDEGDEVVRFECSYVGDGELRGHGDLQRQT